MTVSSSASRNQYTATAGQTVFAYTFEIVTDDDIVVLKNGVTLTKTADYTVSGVGVNSGGNVTLVVGATAGDILTLYRDMAYERLTDYTNAGDFLAADVNNDFDRLWIATQQVNEEVNRSLKAPVTDPLTIDMTIPAKADRLNKILRFNATTGDPEVITLASGATSAANVSFTQAGAGAVERTVETKLNEPVSVKDFGAVGDGVTDDTAAIQAAIAAANTAGASLYFPFGTYMANSLDFTVGFTMAPEAKLKFNGSTNGYVADLTANDKRIGYASFDGALSDCTLLKISGDRNFVGSVYVANSVASASGTSSLYGVAVLGDNNNIESISAYKIENTGYSNESFPQAVFVFGNSNNIQNIYGDYCQSVVVTGASSDNTVIQNIIARNSHDNGIYWLGGDLLVGRLDYFGNDEPLVCKGSSPSKFKIASLNNYGTGTVGIDNATGDIEIEHLYISGTASSIIRLRSGNTASGRVKIHKITGIFTGETLWSFGTGTLDYLSISEMDVTYNYDAAVSGAITSWANYTGCKGFNFGLLKIKIVDVNNILTASNYFSFLGPDTNLTYRSFVNRINITVVDADGVTQSDGYVRIARLLDDPLVHVENGRVQVNIGPHLREVSDDTLANGIVIIGSSAPTIGTWRRGQVVWYSAPSAGNAPGAVCVSAGTPGTWKEMADLAV
jgi:hypothetical protein